MIRSTKQTKERLGNKIQKLRKNLDLSQEELAAKLNISRTHMGHIEQGRKSPSLKLLTKISKELKTDISDLF
jgi:DNA-binding XRE family transcriptional regulator